MTEETTAQADEIKRLEVNTPEDALNLLFGWFMQNAHWFAQGVQATDVLQAGRYILVNFEGRINAIAEKQKEATNVQALEKPL